MKIRNLFRNLRALLDDPTPTLVPAVEAVAPGAVAPWATTIDARLLTNPKSLMVATDRSALYKAPELPPNVVPKTHAAPSEGEIARDAMALDDGSAPLYGWAAGFNNPISQGVGFPGYPYLAELTQLSEYRSPSETISTEMTRKWLEFKIDASKVKDGDGDAAQEKLDQLKSAFEEFRVQDLFRKAALQDGFFGRSQIYVKIKGYEDDDKRQLPLILDPAQIAQGSLLSLSVIEPYWTTPYSYDTLDPSSDYYYKPQSWYVVGRKTHTTRLLTFIAREMPDLLKPSFNFSGVSMSQLMTPYIDQWLKTRNSVAATLSNFSTSVLATNMQATLQDSSGQALAGGTQGLFNRAQLFNNVRDNRGLMLLDKDSEEFIQVNTPLSGLDALQAQAQEHMAAPCHIPLVKLFGITPTGLNANSDGEIQVFYDFVKAMQENLFGPHVRTLLKVFQLHLFGEVDDAIGYEWVPMVEQTQKELSDIRKSDGETDNAYINSGVLSPDEVRSKVAADPNSGYNNLTGDAPGPPAIPVDPNQIDPETGKPHADLPGSDDDDSVGDDK